MELRIQMVHFIVWCGARREQRLLDRLTPAGYLFVGSSESLANLDPRFVTQHHCRSIFYQLNKQVAAMT